MPILTPEERLGTTVAGKYEIDRILGSGGMGVVFAAHHKWTRRKVALKLLRHEAAQNPDVVRRFLREAKAAAQLRHPSVIDVLDMGHDAESGVYLALELLEGEPLSHEIEREKGLDVARAIAICLPVLDALAEAHMKGIVHRDLKPDNIFVSHGPGGDLLPKVLDFGIAKVLEGAKTLDTQTGTVLGTPYYMSPEQASGTQTVGPPADVWSMGVVLYEALTGERPFDGPSATAILLKIMTGDVPTLRDVDGIDDELASVIDRALLRQPSQRYENMGTFATAIREAAAEASIDAPSAVTLSELKTFVRGEGEEAYATTLRPETPPPEPRATDEGASAKVETETVKEARVTGATPPTKGMSTAFVVAALALVGLLGAGFLYAQWPGTSDEPSPAVADQEVPDVAANVEEAAPQEDAAEAEAHDVEPAPIVAPAHVETPEEEPEAAEEPAGTRRRHRVQRTVTEEESEPAATGVATDFRDTF